MSSRVCGAEVERTEIDRVVRGAIEAVKCHAQEALLLDVLPAYVQLDRAVGELDALHVRHAFAGALGQTHTFPRAVREPTHGAVEDPQAFRVERPLLAGNGRGGDEGS